MMANYSSGQIRTLLLTTRIGRTPSTSNKAAVCIYIGGLMNGALRADLMTNWQYGKYNSIIALHNNAAKNCLWRASSSAFVASTPSNSFTDH